MGIEPTSLAWEARVIAIIRRPQSAPFYAVSGGLRNRDFVVGGAKSVLAAVLTRDAGRFIGLSCLSRIRIGTSAKGR
jgi:hypothetical protein